MQVNLLFDAVYRPSSYVPRSTFYGLPNQKPRLGQFPSDLLHTLKNPVHLFGGWFLDAVRVLREKALIHADSVGQRLHIDDLVELEKAFQIVLESDLIDGVGEAVVFKHKVQHIDNHTLKLIPVIATCHEMVLLPISNSRVSDLLFENGQSNLRFLDL
jgi:hypothetical protein